MPNLRRMMMAAAGSAGEETGVWTEVGSTQVLSVNAMSGLTTSTAAFVVSGVLKTYSFNGTTWSQVGNGLTISGSDNIHIRALTSTRVAWIDSSHDQLYTFDWDGTDWSQLGDSVGLTTGWGGHSGIARLSASRVAIAFGGENKIATYDLDGEVWSLVGNVLSSISPGFSNTQACGISSTRIVVLETCDTMRAFDFDGTDWSQTGNTTTITPLQYAGLDRISENKLAIYYAESYSGQSHIIKYKFDGADFSVIEASYDDITASVSNKLASLSVPGEDASRIVTQAGTANMHTFDFVVD